MSVLQFVYVSTKLLNAKKYIEIDKKKILI